MLPLELLSPAGNADIGIQAIRHGADAVYIGPPSHGARSAAANSLDDIRRLTDYAHIFDARVYVTVNTIIYENELRDVERMIRELYDIGVDALIVQDMALLRMDIPPIALHASTQCDIRTPEKARFLQEAGFSQLVLARELSLEEIGRICRAVTIPVETFVHGALCVSFSGRCGAGFACAGRSGNRGECPQICRQSFTLTDADGKVLAK
ncbi:MAG: U32 family peptidase, partial [Muribaculaceae bacterium]|nr:U32 family peptidase [Muribaculaceae bacterium]